MKVTFERVVKGISIFILSGIVVLIVGTYLVKKVGGKLAQAHFDYQCENLAGEFIYRTVDGVEGVFQMRPRDPRDYFSRMRKGDIPEDPFGHTNLEAQRPWQLFVQQPQFFRYHFFESSKGPFIENYDSRWYHEFKPKPVVTGEPYWRFEWGEMGKHQSLYAVKQVSELRSKYGFTWRQIESKKNRRYGIYHGELSVVELATGEVLGRKVGFVIKNKFLGKGGICPRNKNSNMTYSFVKKILKPKIIEGSFDE